MSNDYCNKCRSQLKACPTCKGKGTTYQSSGILSGGSQKPCPNCNGLGKLCPKHGNNHG